MLFSRLADFVVKRYKLIIIVWIVTLFYVFPLLFKVGDVIVYQESEAGLEELEAVKADAIIAENFAGMIPPSTITVVIQNSNVLSNETRDFTWSVYQDMISDSGLQSVESINFLYKALQAYYTQVITETAPAAHSLYNQTGSTAQMVFGVPMQIAYGHMSLLDSMNLTVSLTNDSLVKGILMDSIEAEMAASGADAASIAFTMGYAEVFYDYWLVYHAVDEPTISSLITQSADLYFTSVGGEAGAFGLMIAQAFSLDTYDVPQAVQQYALSILSTQSGIELSFLYEIWPLGPAPTAEEAAEFSLDLIFSRSFEELPAVPGYLVGQFVNVRTEGSTPNNTMLMAIALSVPSSSDVAGENVRHIREIVQTRLQEYSSDFTVYVSGSPAFEVDIMDSVSEDTSRIDPFTVILVVVLVGLYFRSAITPWVPLMTVGMAYLTSMAFIYLLGSYVLEIHYSVLLIILTVMLGAGTDYCIFIMSRYREERVKGSTKEEAVKTSLTWAGESIATSGATVMIGFGALMIGEFSLIRSMGMALVVAVGMALCFALTMLPSLLMVVGDKVFWPATLEDAKRRAKALDKRGGGYFRRSAQFSLKHSKAIVLAALVISVPAAYLYLTLETSYDFIAGLPDAESKVGIDALGEGFGKGTLMPTYVVVVFDDNVLVNGSLAPAVAQSLEEYSLVLEAHENVRSVSGPTRPFGIPVNESYLASLTEMERATYLYAMSSSIGTDNKTVMLTVVLQDQPFSTYSIGTIDEMRALSANAESEVFGSQAEIYIGGSTAGMTDISRTVANDFVTMRFVVVAGIYVVLLLVLGSLLIPLRLILTVLMNVTWTIAMTMIIFQVFSGVPVLWMMPLILFVVAMGLGMDYDIFLTTRIREEVSKGATDEKAIMTAVERTGGIITACGLVMGGAFGSMMLSKTALLQEFGFGLSFAILLDAMIVRIYLVPAIMLLLQKWNWYAPGRLQRVRRSKGARKH